ncbi:MAG: Cdc6/Cdc18 family protein [Thermoplasmata archaeon]|nr:AAA family ATPase [Thermoplasmata archaeon]
MENIFNKYLERTELNTFDLKVFEPSFVPSRMPHREKEMTLIADNFAKIFIGASPKNEIIYGKSGTGKTAVIKFLGRELKEISHGKKNVEFIYLNCQVKDNAYSVIESIGNAVKGEQIPFTGWSMDRVYTTARNNIDRWNGSIIVVLDEIDRFVIKNGDDLLYQIMLMNSELQNSSITIVGITNDLKFSEFLDPRVKSRLNEEKIVFTPYSSDDITDILNDRLKLANVSNFVTEGAVRLISTLASQENGDARKAIELMKTSIQLAISNNDNTVEERHVFIAKNKLEYDAVAETLKTLPLQTKVLVLSIALLKESGIAQASTGDVFDAYRNLASSAGIPILTPRRITDMLSDLDMLGIISAKVKSMGRYGRTKIIELSINSSETKKIILEDENLSKLKNYNYAKQAKLIF